MTSNEFRQIVGRKPSDDPKADMLRNSNLKQPDQEFGNRASIDNNKEGGTIIEQLEKRL